MAILTVKSSQYIINEISTHFKEKNSMRIRLMPEETKMKIWLILLSRQQANWFYSTFIRPQASLQNSVQQHMKRYEINCTSGSKFDRMANGAFSLLLNELMIT